VEHSPTIELSESLAKRLQRVLLDTKYRVLALSSRWLVAPSIRRILSRASVFCCFVGHGRSGGTLVGALLNAHPNVVMSNELNALRRLRMGMTASQLFRLIYLVSRRQALRGSRGGGGYSYAVPNQWQGRHRELVVIGDRKAGATAYEILRHPETLDIVDRNVALEKKFVHVVRNPFDTITTTFQKTSPAIGQGAEEHLDREIRNYYARCVAISSIEERFGKSSIHYVHHERLIADTRDQLRALCEFLQIEPYPDYLDDCASILLASPHESRRTIAWPERQAAVIRRENKRFAWLADYGSA
jgi:hypothetical protein